MRTALRNLKAVMQEVNTDFEIVGEVDSIFDGVEWFRTQKNGSCSRKTLEHT